MRSLPVIAALLVAAHFPRTTLSAQAVTTGASSVGSVSGIVYDSLERKPLAGAAVQLVGTENNSTFNRSALSDSLGRFMLTDVPVGRYTLGFFHDMLDSLGLEPPLQEVVMSRVMALRADLSIPSAQRMRAAICSNGTASARVTDSVAVVVGFVRNASDRSVAANATVAAEWLEMAFTTSGLTRRVPRLVAKAGENGWFAFCNVPSPGTLAMVASLGADSTDQLEVQVPEGGFLRRDLYVGTSPRVVVAPVTERRDSSATQAASRRLRTGDGRLSGRVVSADSNRIVPGALVRIANGPETRANDRGEWLLTDVPIGTRMLEVRALGYYASRRPVDVVQGGAPVRVPLISVASMLDTVRVRSQAAIDRRLSGFAERKRSSGAGRFLTAADIERRQPLMLGDVFRSVGGMEVVGDVIQMRGLSLEKCTPDFYLNGAYLGVQTVDDVDGLVRPKDVIGIEVYSIGTVPQQFTRGMGGDNCGVVLIWTK
jgi:hypothetical protein